MVTFQQHITDGSPIQDLLQRLVASFKSISYAVQRIGLNDLTGATDEVNVTGDKIQKLDKFAHNTIVDSVIRCKHLACMASEEHADVIHANKDGDLVLLFDPLDGSSNIDSNISVGTIFSIHRRRSNTHLVNDCLQPGVNQLAAGYVIYSASTMLVYASENNVCGFTLDPSIGEFVLTHPSMRMPERGKIYSINEGNSMAWPNHVKEYIGSLKKDPKPRSLRYIGTLVADFHRTLVSGGIFLYPSSPKPKLRLLYEAAPMAMISECAGGMAISEDGSSIMSMIPIELHQKVPLIIGSRNDVVEYMRFTNNTTN
ncbi:MAG: class 1 fructose-bisphosphatase [Nitrososphaerales archaeon]